MHLCTINHEVLEDHMSGDPNAIRETIRLLVETAPQAVRRQRERGNPDLEAVSVINDRWWRSSTTSSRRGMRGWVLYADDKKKVYLLTDGRIATDIKFYKKLPPIGVRFLKLDKLNTDSLTRAQQYAIKGAFRTVLYLARD